ncbi:MAG: acyltransferase [Terrimicrobiaceae bacterium]|nr:acyltransferase [Terrimicrobiaceae bacterium]
MSESRRRLGNLIYSAWDLLCIRLGFAASTWRSRLSLALQGCRPGADFATIGRCSFKARTAGSIRIGRGVRFLGAWRANRAGFAQPVLLQTFGAGVIEFGDHSGGSGISISARSSVVIGRHVNLGAGCCVWDHDFHALDPALRRLSIPEQESAIRAEPVVLGDDVFVGARALILKGARIGDRTIVAAGSVVFRGDYPADAILAGNPAAVRAR